MSVATSPDRGAPRQGGGYQKPSGTRSNFEVWSWFFMRISGLILIFLALYHLVWWNLVIGVEHLDSQVVIERWRNLAGAECTENLHLQLARSNHSANLGRQIFTSWRRCRWAIIRASSKLISFGISRSKTSSSAFSAWPDVNPRAGEPCSSTDRNRLKRVVSSVPAMNSRRPSGCRTMADDAALADIGQTSVAAVLARLRGDPSAQFREQSGWIVARRPGTTRSASRYQFQYFRPDGALPLAVAQELEHVGLDRLVVEPGLRHDDRRAARRLLPAGHVVTAVDSSRWASAWARRRCVSASGRS